jgi:hypothetical protein
MTPEQRNLIVTTLRNLIDVQDDEGHNILMGQPGFWNRCHLVPLNTEVHYVDGYAVACKWNSWRVAQLYPNLGSRSRGIGCRRCYVGGFGLIV